MCHIACIIISCILFLLIVVLPLVLYIVSAWPAPPVHFIRSEQEGKVPADWKGMPVDAKSRFMNLKFPFYQNWFQILGWLPSHAAVLIKNRSKTFPVHTHIDDAFLKADNTLIWLGHASFFMRINGINLLIDPQFYNAGPYRRHTENPIAPTFFKNIDYLLLSHDHNDHADVKSLQQLCAQNPSMIIITGLGMDKWIKEKVSASVIIHTMGWYDVYEACCIDIAFIPSRHYTRRPDTSFNKQLWGGFIIQSIEENSRAIYFAGDSGYDEKLFTDIKELYAPSVAMFGIGAYKPYYFMHPNHIGPKEALKAFEDCGADVMIPMHYSTFFLGNEMAEEPLDTLKGLQTNQHICITQPGETIQLKQWI